MVIKSQTSLISFPGIQHTTSSALQKQSSVHMAYMYVHRSVYYNSIQLRSGIEESILEVDAIRLVS